MRHVAPNRHRPAPAGAAYLLVRGAQATAVLGAVLVIGRSLSEAEPPARTAEVVAAEADTRAFLDERAAVHLRKMRDR